MTLSGKVPSHPLAIVALAACLAILPLSRAMTQGEGGVTGRWLTQDGKAVIAIAPCGNSICGRLDWLIEPTRHGAPARDEHNPDPSRRNEPLCGLTMLYGFQRDPSNPGHWQDGYIYDPDSGKIYHAEISARDAQHLDLRGYVGIPLFGETQTWARVAPNHPVCHAR